MTSCIFIYHASQDQGSSRSEANLPAAMIRMPPPTRKRQRKEPKNGPKTDETPVWEQEKDEDEQNLESLLFGKSVSSSKQPKASTSALMTGLEHVSDTDVGVICSLVTSPDRSQLFFFDSGEQLDAEDADEVSDVQEDPQDSEDDEDPPERVQSVFSAESPAVSSRRASITHNVGWKPPKTGKVPAWQDPEDEHLRISLAGDRRLRKLRDTPAEDIVSGKDYEARLRKQ